MNLASIGASIWTGIQKIPALVWWLVLGLLFFKWVEFSSLSRGKKEEGEKRDKEAAEAVTEVVSNITENTDAVIHDADAVRAGDAIVELPDGTKTLPDYHFRD
jgi:hypothetical protein